VLAAPASLLTARVRFRMIRAGATCKDGSVTPPAPRVSVILRTKNRPVLLERALASVLGQTLADLSLIVVDDEAGGTSASDVLERVGAANDPRVRLIQNEESLGRAGAINAGLDAADSDYWVLHDDDDTWHPDFLTTTVAHLDAFPEDGAVVTRCEVVFEHLDEGRYVEDRREVLAGDTTRVTLAGMLARNAFPPISMLVRRSAQVEVGAFDPSLPVQEDWEFNLRLLRRYPIGFIDGQPLAFWHHRLAATGDDANSVIAEAGGHLEYESLVRDAFLRRDLAGAGDGLGHTLAVIGLLQQSIDESRKAQRALNDHVAMSHQALNLEVGRVRGEILALREIVSTIEKDTTRTRSLLERVLGPQGVVRQRIDDLWSSSTAVGKLARRRGRPHPSAGR
jgi:hypothetical protein